LEDSDDFEDNFGVNLNPDVDTAKLSTEGTSNPNNLSRDFSLFDDGMCACGKL